MRSRMERVTPGQHPRPNYGHPHGCDYAEQAPVVIGEVGATDLSSEHAEPVAQDDDLEVLAAA